MPTRPVFPALVLLSGALFLLLLLQFVHCQDRPSKEEADRQALETVLRADALVDRVLRDAEKAQAAGDEAAAVKQLEEGALPLVDDALTKAKTLAVTTPWGRSQRDEWVAILTERRAEIPRYTAALRGENLEQKLAAVETQVALEKRALKAVERAHSDEQHGK